MPNPIMRKVSIHTSPLLSVRTGLSLTLRSLQSEAETPVEKDFFWKFDVAKAKWHETPHE